MPGVSGAGALAGGVSLHGHDQVWSHKKRLIEECTACGKQHSLLAGTIFEQTKTGLSRWFLVWIGVEEGPR